MYTGNPQMDILANNEDPDEMQHHAAFHLAKIKTTVKESNTNSGKLANHITFWSS